MGCTVHLSLFLALGIVHGTHELELRALDVVGHGVQTVLKNGYSRDYHSLKVRWNDGFLSTARDKHTPQQYTLSQSPNQHETHPLYATIGPEMRLVSTTWVLSETQVISVMRERSQGVGRWWKRRRLEADSWQTHSRGA